MTRLPSFARRCMQALRQKITFGGMALLAAGCLGTALTPIAGAVPPDRQAPGVTITSPYSGTTYTVAQTVTIAATTSDNVGVSRVEFYDNGVLRGTDTVAPFSWTWSISSAVNGSHSWTARAYDARGNMTTSGAVSLSVNIATSTGDTTSPTASITSPASGTTYSTAQTVYVYASAADNVGVSRIEFYDNGALKCSSTATSCAWPITSATNCSHVWSAKAYDAAGNFGTSSGVTLNVNIAASTGDTTPPTVSITGPSSGTTLTTATTISINAGATDNVGVSRLEFYDNGILKCSGTGLSCSWPITSALNGTHSWTAKAFDAAGNSATSAAVSLTVNIQTVVAGAGTVQWVDAFGGPATSDIATGRATAIDGSGNVFVAATLSGSGDFNPSAPLFSSNTNGNIVLAKYASGGGLIWTRMLVGTATTAQPTAVKTDAAGAVYVTGYFQGSIDFGAGSLTSTGGYSMFVARFGGDGSLLWARRYGTTGSTVGNAIALDSSGGLYVAGYLQGAGDFGGGAVASNAGSRDAFVAKYNAADGGYQWARVYGGAGTDAAAGIDVGPDGQPVVTGNFQQSMTIASSHTSSGSDDVFVAKLSSSGAPVWSTSFGGASSDQPAGVGIDGSGNIVVAARYYGSISVAGLALPSLGDYDIALVKLTSAGTPVWSKGLGGLFADLVQAIDVNGNGDIAITGTTLSAINFGGGYLYDNGSFDIFVAKFNSSGGHVWSKRAGKLSDDRGTSVAIDAAGNVALTGFFVQGINFGSGDILNSGGADGFIAKFAP